MAATNSSITLKFGGLRLLLVGTDQSSREDHHYMLLKDSHRVTVIGQVSTGLSLILCGNDYDCVLVDADKSDIDMVDFIDQVLKNQPQQAVIVMGSSDIQRQRIVEEAKKYKSVAYILKPCGGGIICNMLQCLCCKKMAVDEGTSNGKLLKKNLGNSSTMNINISVRNGINHQGENLNLEKHGAMSKPVYVDISSDEDDEPLITKSICSCTMVTNDKGKQRVEQKRKEYQAVEDDAQNIKRKEITSSIVWTPALDSKFKEVVNELDKKKVYSPTALKQMKAEALQHNDVASHFQTFLPVEGANNIKKTSFVEPTQNVFNLPTENFACRRFGVSTSFESSNQTPSNLNFSGISLMHIDNIKESLNGFTQLPLPQHTTTTTTTANNSSNDVFQQLTRGDVELIFEDPENGTDQGNEFQLPDFGCVNEIEPHVMMDEEFLKDIFGEEMPPPAAISPTVESPRTETYKFPNFFDNGDSGAAGGSAANEVLANFDRFGLPVDPWVTADVNGVEASSKDGLDDTNGETYVDAEGFINVENVHLEPATFGPSADLSPRIPGEVSDMQSLVNSSLPSDGSVIDDNWYLNLIQHDQESSIKNLDEDYGRIVIGSIFGD